MLKSEQEKAYEAIGYIDLYTNERNELFGRKPFEDGRYHLPSLNSWDGFGLLIEALQVNKKLWHGFRKEVCTGKTSDHVMRDNWFATSDIKLVYVNPPAFLKAFTTWLELRK